MRGVRTTAAVVCLGAALALAGCSRGEEPAGDDESGRTEIAPEGDALEIEALDDLGGGETYSDDVLSIAVPEGMTASATPAGEGTSIQLRAAGAPRAAVIVTVTPQEPANPDAVDAASAAAAAQLGASGVVDDLERVPATWSAVPYAVAATYTITLEGAEPLDGLLVTTHNEAETYLVAVSTEAPQGELLSSPGYDALRTLTLKD